MNTRKSPAAAVKGVLLSEGSTVKAQCSERLWQRHMIGLMPLAALYLLLAFYQIGDQSLWTDEVISFNRTAAPSLWARVNSQSTLYFVLLGLWTDLAGTTEWALRSLSAVFGLAAVFLVYAVALRFFDRRTALVSAALLATSPYVIWYAQEVRYITLMLFTSLAMTYSFQRAVDQGSPRWWAVYGVTCALALLTFITMVLLIIGQGVYLLFRRDHRPQIRKWLVSQLVIGLLFAPWFISRLAHKLPEVLSERPRVVSHEEGRSREKTPMIDIAASLPYTFFAFSAGFSLGPSLKELHESRSVPSLLKHAPIVGLTAIIFGSLFFLGLRNLRRERSNELFLLLWIAVPMVGVFLIATLTTYHVYNTRYVAMALPAYLLILARGMAQLRGPGMHNVALAAVLSVNGLSLSNYYFDPNYGREDSRGAARYLESAAGPKDIIVVVGHPRPFRYYYEGALPVQRIDARGRNGELLTAKLRELVDRHSRLWLVEIRSMQRDPKGRVKSMLDMLANRGEHKEFPGVDIYAYESLAR